ncbi:MAG: F0F1 ATP synthase subunit epsilon [Sulfuritalea sp.]|nr:F0F1 ATP synthase subunit epsilon [Sulfuritalea sp.]
MSGFTLNLLATDRSECIDGVTSFVGEDKSGSFGLLPGHERFMTVLGFGLARVRRTDDQWEYLGFPGGLLYFLGNECRISTRRYLRDTDVTRIAGVLSREMLEEERALDETRHKLHRLEAEMLKRLAELGRE